MQQKIPKLRKLSRTAYIIPMLCGLAIFSALGCAATLLDTAEVAAEADIMPLAADPSATTSLKIGGTDKDQQVIAGYGQTNYSNTTVTIAGNNIDSYALTINGPAQMTGATEISGTAGTTGAKLEDNTWGYAYGQTGNNSEMTYSAFTDNTTTLENKTLASGSLASQTKNLIFAVKFSDEAELGRYYAEITLSLTATPRDITGIWSTGKDSGIRTMQKMNNTVCNQVSTPAATATSAPTMILEDTRDGNYYTIAKLPDGNCWMTESLRLMGQKNLNASDGKTLLPSDTDINSNYVLPATQTGTPSFTTSNYTTAESYYKDAAYGVYYSWMAATAGTAPSSGDASSSLCPRGWKLPPSSGNTSYANLISKASISANSTSLARLYTAPYNFLDYGSVDGNAWGAGHTDLWMRTAYNSNYAYNLRTNRVSTLMTADNSIRYRGLSMRCVADPSNDGLWATMTTMQEMTPAACKAAATGATKVLTDTRDQSAYTIRKHSDGNCWMTQNLRLVNYTTTANDSQTAGISIPNSLGGFTTVGSDASTKYNVEAAYYGGNANYGAYYSWYTATAHTGTSAMTSGNATGSICPKGWRLPKGNAGTANEFARSLGYTSSVSTSSNIWTNVGATFSNNAMTANGISWAAAGFYIGSSLSYSGTNGGYWSSTAYDKDYVYILNFSDKNLYPANYYDKHYGFSVRCLAPSS